MTDEPPDSTIFWKKLQEGSVHNIVSVSSALPGDITESSIEIFLSFQRASVGTSETVVFPEFFHKQSSGWILSVFVLIFITPGKVLLWYPSLSWLIP